MRGTVRIGIALTAFVVVTSCALAQGDDIVARRLILVGAGSPAVDGSALGGALNINGSNTSNGEIVLNPGAVSGNGKVIINAGAANDYTLLVRSKAAQTTMLRLESADGTQEYLHVIGDGVSGYEGSLAVRHVFTFVDSLYNIGDATTRFLSGYFDDVTTEDLFFRRQGAGSQDFLFQTGTNVLDLKNSAGTTILRFDEQVGIEILAFRDFIPGAAVDLGISTAVWDDAHITTVHAYTSVVPDADGGAALGTDSLRFSEAHVKNFVDIGAPFSLGDTTGSLTIYNATAAAGAVLSSDDLGIGATAELSAGTSLVPGTTNTYHLGYSSRRWAKVWATDLDISGTCTGCGGGTTLPVADTTEIVKGSTTASKLLRLEVDGLTASTTRVWTAQDTNLTVAGIDVAQTWTATQTTQALTPSVNATYDLGSSGARYDDVWFDTLDVTNTRSLDPVTSNAFHLGTASFVWNAINVTNAYLGTSAGLTGQVVLYNASTAGSAIITTNNLTTGVDIQVGNPLYPSVASTYALGLQTRRWSAVYSGLFDASTGYRGPSGVTGTSTTLACGAGEAVKNVTVSGGVVTAISCGAP